MATTDLFKFSNTRCFEFDDSLFAAQKDTEAKCDFDEVLQSLWCESVKEGHFRYKLDELETKIIPGKYSFVAQLNIKRAVERRKPQFISTISMPFNPDIFHFMKIGKEEVLFKLSPLHWKPDGNECKKKVDTPTHLLIINVSPLEYCNSLLVPHISQCLPQILSFDGLRLALEIMLLSRDPALRIGFNSLGAYASVNHLHFHLYYLQQKLYLETAVAQHLAGDCYEIVAYPSEGFVFQLLDAEVIKSVRSVMKLATFLLDQEIPHNIFITRGTAISIKTKGACVEASETSYEVIRIYVWARKATYGAKNDDGFNPALCELAGHLPIKNKDYFDTVTENQVEAILRDVCHETFVNVRQEIKQIFNSETK